MGPLAGLLRKQAVQLHSEATAGAGAAQPGAGGPTAPAAPAAAETGRPSGGPSSAAMQRMFAMARLLNVLVTVRGYKTVVCVCVCKKGGRGMIGYSWWVFVGQGSVGEGGPVSMGQAVHPCHVTWWFL